MEARRAPTDPQPAPALLERLAFDKYAATVVESSSSTSFPSSLLLSHSAYFLEDLLLDPFLEDPPVWPFAEPPLAFCTSWPRIRQGRRHVGGDGGSMSRREWRMSKERDSSIARKAPRLEMGMLGRHDGKAGRRERTRKKAFSLFLV